MIRKENENVWQSGLDLGIELLSATYLREKKAVEILSKNHKVKNVIKYVNVVRI